MEIWHFKRYPQTRIKWLTSYIHRAMQVRVGSILSDYYDQEQGVPQGGVLSTTLFSIKINDIVQCLGNLTDCSLYVDDFCICYRSKIMATIERQLQQNVLQQNVLLLTLCLLLLPLWESVIVLCFVVR